MRPKSKHVVILGVKLNLIMVVFLLASYYGLAMLLPAMKSIIRVVFFATAGMAVSINAMVIRVAWLTYGAPDPQCAMMKVRILPNGAGSILGFGWLLMALSIVGIWQGRMVGLFAGVIGGMLIIGCLVWSTYGIGRQVLEPAVMSDNQNQSHDAG